MLQIERMLKLLALLLVLREGSCIIGYDCSNHVANLTTLSLLQIVECDIEEPKISTTRVQIDITLQDYYVTVNLNTNEVVFRSGMRCKMTETECVDIEAGYSFRDSLPKATCKEGNI